MTRQEMIEKIARAIAEMEGFYATTGKPTLAQRNANPGNIRQWRDARGRPYPSYRGYVDFVAWAIPLALRGAHVTAVDPSAEMLDELRDRAHALGIGRSISCTRACAESLPPIIGEQLSLVVFGRSFHLTRREQVLRDCDVMVLKGGTVAVIRAKWPKGQPKWIRAGHSVSLRYSAGGTTTRGFAVPPPPSAVADELILGASAFRYLRKRSFDVENIRNLEQAVGFHFAMPDCSPSELTVSRLFDFEAELRATLAGLRLVWLRSGNGKLRTTTSPLTNWPRLHPPRGESQSLAREDSAATTGIETSACSSV